MKLILNEKEVLDKIEFSKKLVEDQPEPFRIESFEIILNKLLDSDISTKKTSSNKNLKSSKIQNKEIVDELIIVDDPDRAISSLANELGIKLDQLKDIISINGNKVELISSINDSSLKQKLIKASLCVLLLFEKLYNLEWVKASIITEKLREIGIHDSGNNLSTYLKDKSDLFRYRGSSANREYKLTTTNGRKKALEILKNLSSNKENKLIK